jgi:hypothetical protein
VDRNERLNMIDRLKAETDAHRENLLRRQEKRENDPMAMHDHLMAGAAETQRAAPVQRDGQVAGLLYRVTETTPAPAQTGSTMDPETQVGWDRWLRGHLDNERAEMLEILTKGVGEGMSEYVFQRLQPLRTEIADLKRILQERDERAHALSELKREFQGERVEHEALALASALAVRDAKIEKLEEKLGMLLRFLSLQGLDLPRGM